MSSQNGLPEKVSIFTAEVEAKSSTVQTIIRLLVFLHNVQNNVIFCCLLSHMGITRNKRADSASKAAQQKDVLECLISYTDTYQYISQYVHDLWQSEWDMAVNKLHATKTLIGEQSSAYRSVHRDQVVLYRLKLGHSYRTHFYLVNGESPPECVTYHFRPTINHILLVDCIEYEIFRLILFDNSVTLKDIFNNVSPNKIISFTKRAGL